jgi:hypothetical protein
MALGIKIHKDVFAAGRERFAAGGDEFGNVTLEPGFYVCQLVGGRAVDTQKGPAIVFDLIVTGETDKTGGKIGVFYTLDPEKITYLFRTLALLGYDVTDLDEKMLEEIIEHIKTNKPVVRVKATRRDDMTFYRIDKHLTDVTINSEGTENAADADALGGKAGIVEKSPTPPPVPPKQVQVTPAPKAPVKPSQTSASAKAPPPTVKAAVATAVPVKTEPAPTATDDEEVVIEEGDAPAPKALAIGMVVKAMLNDGEHEITITGLHPGELDKDGNPVDKLTGKSSKDGKARKFPISKLID